MIDFAGSKVQRGKGSVHVRDEVKAWEIFNDVDCFYRNKTVREVMERHYQIKRACISDVELPFMI